VKRSALEFQDADAPAQDDVVHEDPVEVRGDDHLLATVADPGHPLADALADVVDEKTAEREQRSPVHEPWLGQQDPLQRGPPDFPGIGLRGRSCGERDHGQQQQT